VPPSDPAALRGAMRTLWDNPELARRMGARAEARYHELFTSEHMAASYTDLYKELVASRTTARAGARVGLAGVPPTR
jgi:rhamnosyl/mannosyltransferase